MSLIDIFPKNAPQIAKYEIDAILERRIEFGVEFTSYPIENGARVSDHRVIKPIKYSIIGVVSSKPLTPKLVDLGAGLVSNLSDNPAVALATGLSASYLASDESTRPEAALRTFVEIMEGKRPFDVVSGSIILRNMLIKNFSVEKQPGFEDALYFTMDLERFVTLDRLDETGNPSHKNMRQGSPRQASCAKEVNKGTVNPKEV